MPRVPEFYSIKEVKKPAANRVHHNNNSCPSGRDIPQNERRSGTGNYRSAKIVSSMHKQLAKLSRVSKGLFGQWAPTWALRTHTLRSVTEAKEEMIH